ncbi:polysaccharide biosynthesis protein [Clostridium botulinum]|nr:polysaccharide biosynthesis protein [Clostridium botulinum]NFS95149.1 polysaccharide biosynthesis protein [Clostridium botulinum]
MNIKLEQLKKLNEKGLFHIFGTSIVNKILSFFTNIFVVNFLSKAEYGILGYSNNLLNIFLLFSGLGLTSAVLQFCSEKRDENEKTAIYKYGFIGGLLANLVICILLFIFSICAPINIEESREYISLLSFMPIIQYLFEYTTIILRTKRMNKQFALMQNLNVVLYFIFSMFGAYKFGIIGVIFGRYLAFILTFIVGCIKIKNIYKDFFNNNKLKKNLKKEIIKYSGICCASNSISQLLYLLDIFFIGLIIANEIIIAEYQVATLIPNALLFIPMNLMIFIYPYFAEKKDDKEWVKKTYFKLIKYLGIFNLLLGLMLFILAPIIIKILWGENYIGSLPCFRILSISFIISATFRIPAGNILAMMRKVRINLYISIVSGIANIILDIVLIKNLGSIGAAISTLSVVIVSSMIAVSYIITCLNK